MMLLALLGLSSAQFTTTSTSPQLAGVQQTSLLSSLTPSTGVTTTAVSPVSSPTLSYQQCQPIVCYTSCSTYARDSNGCQICACASTTGTTTGTTGTTGSSTGLSGLIGTSTGVGTTYVGGTGTGTTYTSTTYPGTSTTTYTSYPAGTTYTGLTGTTTYPGATTYTGAGTTYTGVATSTPGVCTPTLCGTYCAQYQTDANGCQICACAGTSTSVATSGVTSTVGATNNNNYLLCQRAKQSYPSDPVLQLLDCGGLPSSSSSSLANSYVTSGLGRVYVAGSLGLQPSQTYNPAMYVAPSTLPNSYTSSPVITSNPGYTYSSSSIYPTSTTLSSGLYSQQPSTNYYYSSPTTSTTTTSSYPSTGYYSSNGVTYLSAIPGTGTSTSSTGTAPIYSSSGSTTTTPSYYYNSQGQLVSSSSSSSTTKASPTTTPSSASYYYNSQGQLVSSGVSGVSGVLPGVSTGSVVYPYATSGTGLSGTTGQIITSSKPITTTTQTQYVTLGGANTGTLGRTYVPSAAGLVVSPQISTIPTTTGSSQVVSSSCIKGYNC